MKRGSKIGLKKRRTERAKRKEGGVHQRENEASARNVIRPRTADAHIDASTIPAAPAKPSSPLNQNAMAGSNGDHMDDTFLTYVAHTPLPQHEEDEVRRRSEEDTEGENSDVRTSKSASGIESRIDSVGMTQQKMRMELQAYMDEMRTRSDDSGSPLVEFPESFEENTTAEAQRQANLRRFISREVTEASEKIAEDLQERERRERGLEEIARLDKVLEQTMSKYIESRKT